MHSQPDEEVAVPVVAAERPQRAPASLGQIEPRVAVHGGAGFPGKALPNPLVIAQAQRTEHSPPICPASPRS
jgi:hypothetical protein